MLPSNTWNEWIEQVAQNKDGTVRRVAVVVVIENFY